MCSPALRFPDARTIEGNISRLSYHLVPKEVITDIASIAGQTFAHQTMTEDQVRCKAVSLLLRNPAFFLGSRSPDRSYWQFMEVMKTALPDALIRCANHTP